MRALGVTGAKHVAWLPNVPTFAAAGFSEIDGSTFKGLMAPATPPPEIVARLNAALVQLLAEADVKANIKA